MTVRVPLEGRPRVHGLLPLGQGTSACQEEVYADEYPVELIAGGQLGGLVLHWTRIWRRLQFDTPAPTGSSRLLEVAVALSAADGVPAEMLSALFDVVATDHPINSAFESLCFMIE